MTPVLFGTLLALVFLALVVGGRWLLDRRGRDGLSLGYKLYIRYSPVWRWRRWRCLRRAGWRCERCNNVAEQAHHRTYERLFHERIDDLEALCWRCHRNRKCRGDPARGL